MAINFFKHLCAAFMAASTLSALAQNPKAENEIRDIMKDRDAAGVSVAVVKNNKIIYTHSLV